MSTKKLLLIFSPALLLAALALFIQIIRYEPLFPKAEEKTAAKTEEQIIPVFPDDIALGSKTAPTVIIAFEDFACAHCRTQTELLDALMTKHPGKIKLIWKGLPVARFPVATELAQTYGYCSARQNKFNEFKTMAFANSADLSEATLKIIAETIELDSGDLADCLASPAPGAYLEKVKQLASILNIQAVPAFFLGRRQITAPASLAEWEAALKL